MNIVTITHEEIYPQLHWILYSDQFVGTKMDVTALSVDIQQMLYWVNLVPRPSHPSICLLQYCKQQMLRWEGLGTRPFRPGVFRLQYCKRQMLGWEGLGTRLVLSIMHAVAPEINWHASPSGHYQVSAVFVATLYPHSYNCSYHCGYHDKRW